MRYRAFIPGGAYIKPAITTAELFDIGLPILTRTDDVPIRLDIRALSRRADELRPLFRKLVRHRPRLTRRTDLETSLAQRLAQAPDAQREELLVGLIRQVTEGRTLIMVEHDMGVVFDLADRISVLVYGKIIATGTPEEVRADPAVQEAYLGAALEADH